MARATPGGPGGPRFQNAEAGPDSASGTQRDGAEEAGSSGSSPAGRQTRERGRLALASSSREAELRAVLELKLVPGLGDVGMRRLLERHGTPTRALEAFLAWAGARAVGGSGERRMRRERLERAMDYVLTSGIKVILESEAGYPDRLRHLHDPPPVLFCAGDPSLAIEPGVAVVGSRRHTEYGATSTEMIAGALARAGAVIISGLARGIDRIAHEAALWAGGRTIAVLGCGIDVAYPPEHLALQEEIGRAGLVLSEFVPGQPPIRHNFPKRNRVLAALAKAVVVIEAGPRSGALITVDHALDLGLDVFAVPGPIGRPTSDGTNRLIQDGANLLQSPAPVLEAVFGENEARVRLARIETPPAARGTADPDAAGSHVAHSGANAGHAEDPAAAAANSPDMWPAGARGAIGSVLRPEAMYIDDLAHRAGVTVTEALALLLEMELEGTVRQMPGMRFSRSASNVEAER